MTIADLIRYQYGNVASQVEGISQAGALEKQLMAMGGDFEDGFYLTAMKTEERRKEAAENWKNKYQKVYIDSTLGDLFQHYETGTDFALNQYFTAPEIRLLKTKVSPYFNLKMKDLTDQLNAHSATLKNAAGERGEDVSEGDMLNANIKKTLYDEVTKIMLNLEIFKNLGLQIKAVKLGNETAIKELKQELLKSIHG